MAGGHPLGRSTFLFWAGLLARRLPAGLPPGCLPPAGLAARLAARPARLALLAFIFKDGFNFSIYISGGGSTPKNIQIN